MVDRLVCSRRRLLRQGLGGALVLPAIGLLAACGGGTAATSGTLAVTSTQAASSTASSSAVATVATTTAVTSATSTAATTSVSSAASTSAVASGATTASTSSAAKTSTTQAKTTASVAAAPVAKAGTLTWVTNHSTDRVKLFQQVAAQFTKANAGMQVEVDNVTANYETAINTWAAGGSLPDVFYNRTFYTALRAQKGFTVPLNDDMARDKISADQYYPTEMVNCTWQGKIHSLPYDWSIYAIYYNKSMFQQQGVPFPPADGSWTWDDLLQTAKRFPTVSQGKQTTWGFASLPSDWALFGTLEANGGKILSDDLKTCVIANAENVQTLQFFADMRQRWKVTPGPGDIPKGVSDPFVANLLAMQYQGSWDVLAMRASVAGHFDWDVAPLPKGSTGKPPTTGAGGAWSIGHDSKQQASAWALLKYITSPDVETLVVADQAGSLPGNLQSTAAYLAAVKKGGQPPAHADSFATVAKDAFPVPNMPFYDQFMSTLDKAVGNIYAGKEAQAELTQVQQAVNAFIPQYQ
jgi:multiple sugar transport system substrate-binding protein